MINGMNKKGVDYVFTGMTWMDGERKVLNTSERLVEKVFDKQQILDYFRRPLYSRIIPGAVLGFFRKASWMNTIFVSGKIFTQKKISCSIRSMS